MFPRGRNFLRLVCFVLLAAGLAGPSPGQQADRLEIDITPVLGGLVRLDGWTGLRIDLNSDTTRDLLLVFPEARPRVQARVHLRARQARHVEIPFPVRRLAPVEVRVFEGGSGIVELRQPVFQRADSRGWKVDIRGATNITPVPDAVHLSPTAMPQSAEGYEPLRSMIADSAALAALNTAQVSALETYLSRCGRLLIDTDANALVGNLKRVAGCGGAGVQRLRAGEEPKQTPLPDPAQILALSDCGDCSGLTGKITVLISGFVIALAVALLTGRAALVAAVPVLALLAMLGTLWPRPVFVEWLAWSQGVQGDRLERTRSVLDLEGRGRAPLTIELPQNALALLPMSDAASFFYRFDAQSRRTTTLELTNEFLKRESLSFDTLSPISPEPGNSPDAGGEASASARLLAERIARPGKREFRLSAERKQLTTSFQGKFQGWRMILARPSAPLEADQ